MTKKKIDMKTLEEEAEKYATEYNGILVNKRKEHFIAGANSKWVQAERIEAQIDVYLQCIPFIDDEEYRIVIRKRISIGEQLLKQLEDESKTD